MNTVATSRNPQANVFGERIQLSALNEGHVETLREWKCNPVLAHSIAAYPKAFSLDDVREWVLSSNADPHQVFLGIFSQATHELLGVARLMFIDWVSRVAELGIYFGAASSRGQGLGRDAVQTLLRHAFLELQLERVHLRVLAENDAAIRCYLACGFSHEGTLRKHFLSREKRHDMVMMGIMRDEFSSVNLNLAGG